MAGSRCNGSMFDSPTTREMRSYCQGRDAAVGGGSYTAPSGVTGVVGNNNAISWTSLIHAGVTANLIDPSANDAALAITVSGKTVNVRLATSGVGAIVSTAAQVIAAVNADPAAKAVVRAANEGASSGAGVVVAESVSLSGESAISGLIGRDADLWARGFMSHGGGAAQVRDCCSHPPTALP